MSKTAMNELTNCIWLRVRHLRSWSIILTYPFRSCWTIRRCNSGNCQQYLINVCWNEWCSHLCCVGTSWCNRNRGCSITVAIIDKWTVSLIWVLDKWSFQVLDPSTYRRKSGLTLSAEKIEDAGNDNQPLFCLSYMCIKKVHIKWAFPDLIKAVLCVSRCVLT